MDPRDDAFAFRVVARAVAAATITELLVLGAVVACWGSNDVSWIHDPPSNARAILPTLAFGLGAGLAFALAEGLPRGAGLVVGPFAALLAPLGGEFVRAMVAAWDPIQATGTAVGEVARLDPSALAAFAAGALLIFGPLVVARRRGASISSQTSVTIVGGGVWLLGVALWAPPDVANPGLTLRPLLAIVGVRGLVFPALLALADLALDRALRSPRPAGPHASRRGVGLAVALSAGLLATFLVVPDEEPHLVGRRTRACSTSTASRFELAETLIGEHRYGTTFGACGVLGSPWTPAMSLLPRVGLAAFDRRLRFLREALAIHEELGGRGHVPSMLRAAELHRYGGPAMLTRRALMNRFDESDTFLPIRLDAADAWERRAGRGASGGDG